MKEIQIKKVFNEVDTQNLKKAYHISKEIENFLSDEKFLQPLIKELYLKKDGLRRPFLNLFVCCFEECWIDWFSIQLKLRMIKTANQEFITFDELLFI